MNFRRFLKLTFSLLSISIQKTVQHGYLADPPQRSSIWRENPDAPVNYNDNQLFCGGRENLRLYGGRCGTCGDPYQGPRHNEAGGKYARGIIVRSYPENQRRLPVKVALTAYHKGFYEFKICPHNNPNVPVSQRCLDRYPLQIVQAGRRHKTKYYPTGSGIHQLTLLLPRGLKCSQCVLQWRYKTGNSWGIDRDKKSGCMGCGHQEEFWNCADISIGSINRNRHMIGLEDESSDLNFNSDPLIKDTGINVLNQFFSPFISTGLQNSFDNFDMFQESQPKIDGMTGSNILDNGVFGSSRRATNMQNVRQSTFLQENSDQSSEEVNSLNNEKSLVLQRSKTHNEIQKQNTKQHREVFQWSSLFNGNHGRIQTSFLPQEDWSLLEFFDR